MWSVTTQGIRSARLLGQTLTDADWWGIGLSDLAIFIGFLFLGWQLWRLVSVEISSLGVSHMCLGRRRRICWGDIDEFRIGTQLRLSGQFGSISVAHLFFVDPDLVLERIEKYLAWERSELWASLQEPHVRRRPERSHVLDAQSRR